MMNHSNNKGEASPDIIPPHGGYRDLKSFQMAEIVFNGTAAFCDRFIDPRSRTHDQMVQTARSGKQNIAEGSMASGTSKKTELKLLRLIHQANFLLDQRLRALENSFLEEGGFTERLYRARTQARDRSKGE